MSSTNNPVFRFPEPQDTSWMDKALCRDLPHDRAMVLFFPEKGQNFKEGKRFCTGTPATKTSAAVPGCPVKNECLKYALSFEPEGVVGVWGGTTASERHKMVDPPVAPNPPVVRSYRNFERLGELLSLVSSVNRGADNVEA